MYDHVCKLMFPGGRRESRVELLVYESLQISVHPKSLNFQAGNSILVTCEASTVPSDFYWERDGYALPKRNSGRITIEADGHRLTLHIKNAKLADQAVYRCVGINNKESGDETVLESSS